MESYSQFIIIYPLIAMVANHNRLWGHIVKTKISRIFQFTKSFFNFFCGPSRLRSEGLSVTGTNVTITPMDQMFAGPAPCSELGLRSIKRLH